MAIITFKKFIRKLDNLGDCAEESDWQLVALKLGEGLMKKRIFQQGKAADGSSLGGYRSAQHIRLRAKKGRQTGKKDLFLDGDLNRAFTVGTNSGDLVLGLSNRKAKLIAEAQQAQTRKTIFKASDQEAKKVAKAAARELAECIRKSYKK